MTLFPPNIILRHRKENLKKCSLRGLESREDLLFFTYPQDKLPSLQGYILLTLDAKELTFKDKDHPVFIIDGTWRYAEIMMKTLPLPHLFEKRSLPSSIKTA